MHRGGSVRIREFVTRFTRFSLEIRKTILFSFRVFSKKSKKRIKGRTEGSISRTLEAATTGTPVDTLRALVEFCWQLLTHKSHSQVRSILAIQLGLTLSEGIAGRNQSKNAE